MKTVMSNSTTISKTNNYNSSKITEHKKHHDMYQWSAMSLAWDGH
jgi:hypothetical protein